MVLANILQSLSGSVNAVYIGQMLGTDALAAVAGMFPGVLLHRADHRRGRGRLGADRPGLGRARAARSKPLPAPRWRWAA
jgi:hypothetical protein